MEKRIGTMALIRRNGFGKEISRDSVNTCWLTCTNEVFVGDQRIGHAKNMKSAVHATIDWAGTNRNFFTVNKRTKNAINGKHNVTCKTKKVTRRPMAACRA